MFAASSVGVRIEAYWGAYAVSKAGLEMFAGILSQELENTSSTRIFTVNPGGTRTKMRALKQCLAKTQQLCQLPRLLQTHSYMA